MQCQNHSHPKLKKHTSWTVFGQKLNVLITTVANEGSEVCFVMSCWNLLKKLSI